MIGAPRYIFAEEARRKAREQRLGEQEEHQLVLRRERDVVQQQQLLMKRTHALQLWQDRELAESRDAATSNSAKLHLRLESEAAAQRQQFAEQQQIADLEQQRNLNQQRLEAVQKENTLQIEYENSSALVKQSALDAMSKAESQRLKDLEAATKRQHQRDLDILSRQERFMTHRKALLEDEKTLSAMVAKRPRRSIIYNGSELD
jgi:hypothetical protein